MIAIGRHVGQIDAAADGHRAHRPLRRFVDRLVKLGLAGLARSH